MICLCSTCISVLLHCALSVSRVKTVQWILLKYGLGGFTLTDLNSCEFLTRVRSRCPVGGYRRFGGTNCLQLQGSIRLCHRRTYREHYYFNLTSCKLQCQFAVITLRHCGHVAMRLADIRMIEGFRRCFRRLVGDVSHQRYNGKLLCVMSQLYPCPHPPLFVAYFLLTLKHANLFRKNTSGHC